MFPKIEVLILRLKRCHNENPSNDIVSFGLQQSAIHHREFGYSELP